MNKLFGIDCNKEGNKLEKAYFWLSKALDYEAEGKPQKTIEMAFSTACRYEKEYFAERDSAK